MRLLVLTASLLLLGLPAASVARHDYANDEARLSKALSGLSPGKPQSCINLSDAQETEAIGKALIFRSGRKLLYRSDTSGGCGYQWPSDIFITQTFSNQLCRGDIVKRADLSSGFESGFCITGDFVPYRPNKGL